MQFLSLFYKQFIWIFSFLFQFFNRMNYAILANSSRINVRSNAYKVKDNCFNVCDSNLLRLIKFCTNRYSFKLICFQQNVIKFGGQYLIIYLLLVTFLLLFLLGVMTMHRQTLYQDWNGELIFKDNFKGNFLVNHPAQLQRHQFLL